MQATRIDDAVQDHRVLRVSLMRPIKERVEIDADLCIGSGECVLAAPEVFAFNSAQVSTFAEGADEADLEERDLERIIRNCPSRALRLRHQGGSLNATSGPTELE